MPLVRIESWGAMPENVQLRDLRLEDLETVMVWAKDHEFCLANE